MISTSDRKEWVLQQLSLRQEGRGGDGSRVVMQSHTGLDPMDHLGADCGIVDVCADVDPGKNGHDVEREGITHGIYHHMFNIRHER